MTDDTKTPKELKEQVLLDYSEAALDRLAIIAGAGASIVMANALAEMFDDFRLMAIQSAQVEVIENAPPAGLRIMSQITKRCARITRSTRELIGEVVEQLSFFMSNTDSWGDDGVREIVRPAIESLRKRSRAVPGTLPLRIPAAGDAHTGHSDTGWEIRDRVKDLRDALQLAQVQIPDRWTPVTQAMPTGHEGEWLWLTLASGEVIRDVMFEKETGLFNHVERNTDYPRSAVLAWMLDFYPAPYVGTKSEGGGN